MTSLVSYVRHKSRHARLGSTLVAATLACAALTAVPVTATAATTTVTMDSSTPITVVTLNKGEEVNITVTLTTTDPNEGGEGEPFTLSYGGNTITYSQYGIPGAISITATTNDEAVDAWIQGADGDESASITINTNPNPLAQAPDPVKQYAAKIGAVTAILSGGFWTCAEVVPLLTVPTATVKTICGIAAAVFGLSTGIAAYITVDPADPNYKTLAWPQALPIPSLSGVPFPERTSLRQLLVNLQEQRALGLAAVTSFNRASGAVDAGSTYWATKQHDRGILYIHRMGWLMAAEPALLRSFVHAIHAARIGDFTITPAQVLSMETSISQNGVPADISGYLTQSGADGADIAQVQQIALAVNIDNVAGTYFSKLIDPSYISVLRAAAHAFITASWRTMN